MDVSITPDSLSIYTETGSFKGHVIDYEVNKLLSIYLSLREFEGIKSALV